MFYPLVLLLYTDSDRYGRCIVTSVLGCLSSLWSYRGGNRFSDTLASPSAIYFNQVTHMVPSSLFCLGLIWRFQQYNAPCHTSRASTRTTYYY